jgi:hypothetical protein
MFALKTIDYVTDEKGKKKSVVLKVTDFERIQEEIEDLEDALELEKARKNATGFTKWKDFLYDQRLPRSRRQLSYSLHHR